MSYHHANDQYYRELFEGLFVDIHDIMVSKSVQIGEIEPYLKTDTVRQKIRDEYFRDSTVTVVLIGTETWKRKHVDWEIGASIRNTQFNPRSGLLSILLPTYHDYYKVPYGKYNKYTIPPRLSNNVDCGFSDVYKWSDNPIDEDKNAAWELYIELLTRITTQPLYDSHGDEETALKSIYAIFPLTREVIKRNGRHCIEFTKIAIVVLNQVIRPFTAKWHRLSV